MGTRVNGRSSNRRVRTRGHLLEQQGNLSVIKVGLLARPWPQLADKLRSAGLQPRVSRAGGLTFIHVQAPLEACQTILEGHKLVRRIKPLWLPVGIVPILAILAVSPQFSYGTTTPQAKKLSSIDKVCSMERITAWLEGRQASENINVLETSVLGGITVGTLKCEDSRYSYTLGSQKPKRVLNLKLLNS